MGIATLGLLLSTLSLHISDAFLPNLGKYPCTVAEPIAEDSINLDYKVSQAKDGEWSLNYDISWSAPMNLFYGVYFAELLIEGRDNPLTPWSFATCSEVLEFADQLEQVNYKTEPEHLLHASFTSRYLFQVSYGDALPRPVPVSLGTSIFFETPDCYTVTGDVEFCSSQDVYRCGVPTNVRLVEVTPGLINGTVVASFEWASPVQVNSMATLVEYRIQIHSSSGDLIISDTVRHSEYGSSHRWVANPQPYQDAPLEEGLSYNFMIVPYIRYTYGNGSLHAGRKFEFNFWASLPDLVDTETTTGIFTTVTNEWTTEGNENEKDFQQVDVPTQETPADNNMMVPVILIISSLLSFFILFFVIVVFLRKHRSSATSRNVELGDVFFKEENIYKTSEIENEVDLLLKDKEVGQDEVILHEKLGEGEFGVVYKGEVLGINRNKMKVICAVKMPKVGALYETKEDLLSEMKLVADLGDHQNILGLLACCSRREPYYLVTEFMKYGDLLSFLRKCRQRKLAEEDPIFCIEETKQVFIAYEISKGMAYIQQKQFYHGDLAARNILVGDGLTIKISDFGLADDIYTRGYKRREIEQKIPIKWCSLETILKGICTSQGDVWSYGVLLYEIFTLGGTPYPGIAARYLVSQLREGYRMEQPENCPDDIYELMLSCWQEDPHERPTFHVVSEQLDVMLGNRSNYFEFEQEDDSFTETSDEKGVKQYLRRASYLSNTYIQNFKVTSPVKQKDDEFTTNETFAPILEEENDIDLTELEEIIHKEQ